MPRQHSRDTDQGDESDEEIIYETEAPRRNFRRRKSSAELLQSSICAPDAPEPGDHAGTDEQAAPPATESPAEHFEPPPKDAFHSNVEVWAVSGTLIVKPNGLSKLTDVDAEAIGRYLSQTSLTKLVLANHGLGDETAKIIGEQLLSNTSLTWLSLHNNRIGDEGGKALANALANGCPALTTLFISGNDLISDKVRSELVKANATRKPPKSSKPLSGLCGLVF